MAAAVARLARLWGLPDLPHQLSVRFSSRLSRVLGRAVPASGRVTLHAALRHGSPRLLREVLCHEAAHVAAWRMARARGAPRPKAHGPEWEALVRVAGFAPRRSVLRSSVAGLPAAPKAPPARTGRRWTHTCPVCQESWRARRPMRFWRCATCLDLGLDGLLVVVADGQGDA